MVELRWVLLGLGILLIAGIYLAGRGIFGRLRFPWRRERAIDDLDGSTGVPADQDEDPPPDEADSAPAGPSTGPGSPKREMAERVITVRFIPREGDLSAETVVLALRAAKLRHGRYGIFHRVESLADEPIFSVASLTEPGGFDLNNLGATRIPGMSFFMVLPGPGDPVERFDQMVETARSLAHELDADLHDEKGSSWSIQRERYLREEIIQYRHQQARH